MKIIVGTYTYDGTAKGVYSYDLCFDTSQPGLTANLLDVAAVANPSYLSISPTGDMIYAVSECDETDSAVNAISLNTATGKMRLLNSVDDCGWGPCHIAQMGNNLAVSNYGDGSFALYEIADGGKVGTCIQLLKFDGRVEKSRIHCTIISPDRQYAVITNLGYDCIYVAKIKTNANGYSELGDYQTTYLEKGCGPRHGIFNRQGSMFYLVTEKSNEIMTFRFNAANGNMELLQTIATADDSYAAAADIHLSPDERHLYASIRRVEDGIAIYKVTECGLLEPVGKQPTGLHPRNFAISHDGEWMMVACRDSNVVEIYRINKTTGALKAISSIALSKPVCVKLL